MSGLCPRFFLCDSTAAQRAARGQYGAWPPGRHRARRAISRSRKLARRGSRRSWHNHTARVTGRSRSGRGLFALSAFLAPLASASTAHAWASVEHQEIGRTSYLRACADLTATVAVPRTARRRREGAPRAGVRAEPAGPGQALWRRDRDRGRLPRPSVRVPVADRRLAVQQQEVLLPAGAGEQRPLQPDVDPLVGRVPPAGDRLRAGRRPRARG